jgi:hypothetical protein
VKWLVLACVIGTVATGVWRACHHDPPAACELPPRDCVEDCDDLVQFWPQVGPGYTDDFVPEEDSSVTSTTYLRRDLMMLVKYAAARVACDGAGWETGHGAPLGLGDASDVDGHTPGTSYGRPRHPRTTHEGGYDIDLAYYQRDTPDNRLRPVCTVGDGKDQFRCTRRPHLLDAKRTALFIGAMFESERVRIIGVDGKVARPVLDQLHKLCVQGIVPPDACARVRLGYETENTGRLWFYGHHNHMHVSVKR